MANWSPLRDLLGDVAESVTVPWRELDALVGGLPRSAYEHPAFWKGQRSRWPGFTTSSVIVGERVTFVRRAAGDAATPQRGREITVRATDTALGLILLSCVKQKLEVPAAAKDLYTSPLFRKGRAYAEHAGVRWLILSAKHGVVDPEQVIEPYDLQLSKTSRDYRRAWGMRVVSDLRKAVGSVKDQTIEIHAGSAYSNAVRGLLSDEGATLVEPLAGLRMGARLAWYGTVGEPKTPGTAYPTADVDALISRLSDADQAMTPAAFLAGAGPAMQSPGLYSWWVDQDGAAELTRGLGAPVGAGLIYVGLAGATRSRTGQRSTNTLWGRIRTMHLGGSHKFSTLRLSLGSILAEARSDERINESTLTDWMHERLRLLAVPVADADTLGAVETEILAKLSPPLNLRGVQRDPLRERLSTLRKKYGGDDASRHHWQAGTSGSAAPTDSSSCATWSDGTSRRPNRRTRGADR